VGTNELTFTLGNGKFLADTKDVIFEKLIVMTRQRVENKNPLNIPVSWFPIHENIKQISMQ
jgi:hypothetical protein